MNFAQRAATAGALAALAVAPAAAQEGAADIGTLLLADPAVKAAMDVVKRDEPQLLLDQVRLCEIPAPSNEETLRGAAVKKLFEDAGLKDVRVDAVGNVFATRAGRASGPRLVMAAHLDTVFPAETELKFPREGDKFTGPGIGDNCRGLAALLGVIRTLQKTNLQTEGPVTFVANVGEEAKGNLRGVTYLFNDGMKGQIDRFISIDGSGEGFTHVGVGAFRYRVTFRGPGGHSYFSFGMANPMFALGRAIAKVAQFQAPADPRTTFSVGLVGGGTSVNSIAGEAWFEVDMRSHDRAALDAINAQFQKAVADAVAEENARWDGNKPVAVEMKDIGSRVPGQTAADAAIVVATHAVTKALGLKDFTFLATTDSNIPMALGVPALTIDGGGNGTAGHSVHEMFDSTDSWKGTQRALLLVLALTRR